jgi:hypothetical protein
MSDRVETVTAAIANLAYAAVVLATVVMMFPALRLQLTVFGRVQLQHWRYGRWLAAHRPPDWVRELRRDDLPAERS